MFELGSIISPKKGGVEIKRARANKHYRTRDDDEDLRTSFLSTNLEPRLFIKVPPQQRKKSSLLLVVSE